MEMKKYFLLFVLSITIFFFHAYYTRHAIYGDGNGYYSYAQALYFDKKLDFNPVYEFLGNFNGRTGIFSRIFWDTSYTETGVIRQNPYLIGTGIIWLPSMLFISIINSVFNLGADRFNLIYELGPGITGIILVISGLYFLEKYLFNFFKKDITQPTILTLFLASNLLYYTAFEPALSHQPAFFLVSFLLYWTYKLKPKSVNFLILGVLCGLLAITRIADTFLLIPVFWQVWKARPSLKHLYVFLISLFIVISPQLLNQYLMYGNAFSNPYLTGKSGIWQFNPIHLIEFLFSMKRGVFFWTPLFLVGVMGLIKSRSWINLFTVALLWVICSSWSSYLSAGFGQRFVFSSIPYFAFGISSIFSKLNSRKSFYLISINTFWNLLLLVGFYMLKLGK
ncbi:MAG: hypothetical protein HYV90_03415 [Candidatus Woesebacteria bacterium]|nr:MAG: hypothetical protein HYV90_03415 [Candidatus Woesebacteria bacterium]